MTAILMHGDKVAGQFQVDPYRFEYNGNRGRVKRVLEAGPPEEGMVGGEPPADVEVDEEAGETIRVDQLRELSPAERRERHVRQLRSLGLRVITPDTNE